MATEKIAQIVCKYLGNEDLLKRVVHTILAMDEEFDGAVLAEEDYQTLDALGVF